MSVITRFAPSPTGLLHIGNLRAALVNWQLARQAAGSFILRFDDTDPERSQEHYITSIEQDLSWAGLDWDAQARQSNFLDDYTIAADQLRAAGRLYPCYETPEELALRRKNQLQSGRPPLYDRAALNLSTKNRHTLESQGRKPHWRFRLEPGEIRWKDGIRGVVRFDATKLSDPVLIRADGTPLYHLPSVVDDIRMGVNHIIRGEDHVDNTAVHIQLFQALQNDIPQFSHLSMLADFSGKGLSKRSGSLGIAQLREQGIEPLALSSYLARIGTARPVTVFFNSAELIADFDLTCFGRATPRFDRHELDLLNARLLHNLPFTAVQPRLAELGLDLLKANFWQAIQPNLHHFAEVAQWWALCHDAITPPQHDTETQIFRIKAANLLPPEPWDQTSWKKWTAALQEITERRGRSLFLPLRQALTGQDHGPEMAVLLPLIGRDRAQKRLNGTI